MKSHSERNDFFVIHRSVNRQAGHASGGPIFSALPEKTGGEKGRLDAFGAQCGFALGFRFLRLPAATSQSALLTAPLKRGAKGARPSSLPPLLRGGGSAEPRRRGRAQCGFALGVRVLRLRQPTSQSALLTAPLERGAKGVRRCYYRLWGGGVGGTGYSRNWILVFAPKRMKKRLKILARGREVWYSSEN